jgi:chorismate-pyruvate lyase
LQQELLSQPSATLVLARWCATYRLAPDPQIIAQRVLGAPKQPPESVRQNLALKLGEAVGYRRVQLFCGDRILSDADNWYVPDRLTPAMNQLLDHTDTPFGLAVRSLHFKRKTLSSERLWTPAASLPGSAMAVPDHVLKNEGLLTVANGLPISQVIENYTALILGPPP